VVSGSRPPKPNGNWLHDHLLSLSLLALFIASWVGQLVFQYLHEVDLALEQGQVRPELVSTSFLHGFWASTLENWQSEFLQLLTFVVLSTFLLHRNSPQSRDGDDEVAEGVRAIRQHLGV
jgi:hypothetical protein